MKKASTLHLMSLVGRKTHEFPAIKHTKTTFVTDEFRGCAAPTAGLPGMGIEALIQVSTYRTFKNVPTAFTFILLDLRMAWIPPAPWLPVKSLFHLGPVLVLLQLCALFG